MPLSGVCGAQRRQMGKVSVAMYVQKDGDVGTTPARLEDLE